LKRRRKEVIDNVAKLAEFIEAAGQSAENISSASWWHPAEQYAGKDIFG